MERKRTNTPLRGVVRLMRPKHWLKNGLIFIAVIFAGQLFQPELLVRTVVGFFAFSLASSAVYVLNDIRDVEADRQHEVKRTRPIASGEVSVPAACVLMAVLAAAGLGLSVLACKDARMGTALILAYFVVNVGYSMGLKHVPFVDILLLVSGFVLRVFYGAAVIDGHVSHWVTLTVFALSFYMSLGKRRNEILQSDAPASTRRVLQYYSVSFLDKFMYLCLSNAIVFYALWSTDEEVIARFGTDKLIWTVPIVILLMMKYSADIEADSYGDPVDVITHDKLLLLMAFLYGVIMLAILYLPGL